MKELQESLLDAFQIRKQITQAQNEIFTYFENNVNKYDRDVNKIKADLPKIAKQAFSKYVKNKNAIKYNDWYEKFEKVFIQFVTDNLKKDLKNVS
jgi:hypothetical protein